MTKTVLCDLGGVLVHYNHEAYTRGLIEALKPMPEARVRKIALDEIGLPDFLDFEAGKIDDERYIQTLERRFDRRLPRKLYWTRIHTGPEVIRVDQQAVNVLRRIKAKHPKIQLALLSNVDPIMLKYCVDAMGFAFDHLVPSFRVRSRKPETFIYKAALAESSTLASDAMFWDDRAENVHTATELGICAYRFTDVPSMELVLTGFNLI